MHQAWLVAVVAAGACGAFVEPTPVAPAPPPPPALLLVQPTQPPQTIVENNFTFVTEAPPPSPPPSPPPPEPPPASRAVSGTYRAPHLCECLATATLPADRAQLASTTVDSCDRYLARAELVMRCSTGEPHAIGRVTESLDLARRSWRGVATGTAAGRTTLVDSCGVAEHQLASVLEDDCPP